MDRDELTEATDAEFRHLIDLNEQLSAKIDAAKRATAEAHSRHYELLTTDASLAELSKSWKKVQALKESEQLLEQQAQAIREKGIQVETKRNALYTTKMREEQDAKRRALVDAVIAANAQFVADVRALYAQGAHDPELLWGGEHTLRYLQKLVVNDTDGVTSSVPVYNSGIIMIMLQKGMLDPGYAGPMDPYAVA